MFVESQSERFRFRCLETENSPGISVHLVCSVLFVPTLTHCSRLFSHQALPWEFMGFDKEKNKSSSPVLKDLYLNGQCQSGSEEAGAGGGVQPLGTMCVSAVHRACVPWRAESDPEKPLWTAVHSISAPA